MARYYGGQTVKEGFYLNRATFGFEPIAQGVGILPGDKGACYSRLPLPAVMVVGPLMGLVYVIVVPVTYCLAFIYFLGRWVAQRVKPQNDHIAV